MQTQWPGLGSGFDLSSLDAAAGNGRPVWTGGPFGTGLPPQPLDVIARNWWNCGTASANGGTPFGSGTAGSGGFNNALFGIVSGLVSALQQLLGALTNGNAAGSSQSGSGGVNGGQQRFENVDVSSTGDPHIAETGTTRAGARTAAVDDRWDSMSAHDDLLHSTDVEGGYRVSTAVTAPGANGVTFNQSATVHANFDQDAVTMNRDGSYAIYDDGNQVQLGQGESATLSGGERVDVHQDGSITVSAQGMNGGTLSTTLRSTGAGVDVTTHGHDIRLGGDAVVHGAKTQAPHHDHGPHHHAHAKKPIATPVQDAPQPIAGVGNP